MTILALINHNAILTTVHPGGWLSLPDGSKVSPAQDGWSNGDLRLAAIQPAEPVPEGKRIASTSVEMVAGQPRYVNLLEDVPPPAAADVDAERDRRVAAGFTFAGVRFQSRPDDRENIAGAATAALGAMMAGAQPGDLRWHGGDTDFVWIAEDNSTMAMDAQTLFAFGQAAMAHKQSMIFAARAIKDMGPIPADYADDQYWPSA